MRRASGARPTTTAGDATYFQSVNRNKDSVVLDFTDPVDLARAQELAVEATSWSRISVRVSPSVWLDYEAVRETNPGIIYCSITGFGRGKGAALPAMTSWSRHSAD